VLGPLIFVGGACAVSKPTEKPSPDPQVAARPAYPNTRKLEQVDVLFGERVADPYRWLEDAKSPDVQTWMAAQDKLARGKLSHLPGRDDLVKRLKQLFYVDTLAVPVRRGANYFYSRRRATQEKAVVYWRAGKQGAEQVLLDPNTWSTDGSSSLGTWVPTWDGK